MTTKHIRLKISTIGSGLFAQIHRPSNFGSNALMYWWFSGQQSCLQLRWPKLESWQYIVIFKKNILKNWANPASFCSFQTQISLAKLYTSAEFKRSIKRLSWHLEHYHTLVVTKDIVSYAIAKSCWIMQTLTILFPWVFVVLRLGNS